MKHIITTGLSIIAIILASQLADASNNALTLSSDSLIVLNGPVNSESVGVVVKQARELDKPELVNKPIYLFLYTPGGEIQMGLEMVEGLKGLHRPVNTVTLFAASMGFQIVQSLGTRNIVKSGVLMSHHAHGGFEGEFGGNGTSQVMSRIGLWEKRLLSLDQQTVDRTNGRQSLESYQSAYDHELWLVADEAVDKGYADAIIAVRCDSSLNGITTKTAEGPFGIKILYDVDNCPINTTPMNVRFIIPTTEGDKDSAQFSKEGGGFGATCLIAKGAGLAKSCALNTSITVELLNDFRTKFRDQYTNIRNHIIPMN